MNARPNLDKMMEATRLTREGRLQDALAMIRSALGGERPATAPDRTSETSASQAPLAIDMAPPSQATANAWSLPLVGNLPPTEHAETASDAKVARGSSLDRPGRLWSDIGISGPARRTLVPVPDGARFEQHVFANHAGSRAYKLYVPSGYAGQAVPLVIMLHGCAQSPDDFALGTRMNDVAEEQTFLVAYPTQARSANPSKCWNWFKAADQQRGQGEPSLIAGLTREIMCDHAVDQTRVYVAGLSAGGAMAAVLGATYPDLYAAVGVHSGLACGAASDMPSAIAAMRNGALPSRRMSAGRIPTIVFHGDRDATVNPVNGQQVIAQSTLNATPRTTTSEGRSAGDVAFRRTVQSNDSGQPVLEHWTLKGVGHAWSGGSAAGSYTEPRGPDASRQMVRFFLQNNKTSGLAAQ